jgi:hypothetical protein
MDRWTSKPSKIYKSSSTGNHQSAYIAAPPLIDTATSELTNYR